MPRPQVCKGFPSAREGLLVNARFVLGQFEKLDGASGHKALKFLETDFGRSLAKEVRCLGGRARATTCADGCGWYRWQMAARHLPLNRPSRPCC